MRCSNCGKNNPQVNNFCAHCGNALARLCGKCAAENPPTSNFCGKCGAALTSGVSTGTVTPPKPDLASGVRVVREQSDAALTTDGERKTVTALFADIKGSMELMEDLDPEEARAIVDPALKLMIDAVHHYDGHVVQSTGDGIFAPFGAPVAHEDHPQRAVYSAVRMQQEMRRYEDRLRSQGRAPIQIRVGINTGEVVVREVHTGAHPEYTAIGHTANLASRLQNLARSGCIVVSATEKLIAGFFQVKSLGLAKIKGASEAVNVYVGSLWSRVAYTMQP